MGNISSICEKKIMVTIVHPATNKTQREKVTEDMTVLELKQKIEDVFDIKAADQILAVKSRGIMVNEKTLADYEIKEGSIITLIPEYLERVII